MTDHESMTGPVEVVYEIDSSLVARVLAMSTKLGWDTRRCLSNGIGLLQAWDRLRAIGEQVRQGGLEVYDFGSVDIDNETGVSIASLMDIGDMVEVQKGIYAGDDTVGTVTMSEELRFNLELYAHSMAYDDLNPVFRDAALFFCNVQELIDQGPRRPGTPS